MFLKSLTVLVAVFAIAVGLIASGIAGRWVGFFLGLSISLLPSPPFIVSIPNLGSLQSYRC